MAKEVLFGNSSLSLSISPSFSLFRPLPLYIALSLFISPSFSIYRPHSLYIALILILLDNRALNSLSSEEGNFVWIPFVIFQNTENSDATKGKTNQFRYLFLKFQIFNSRFSNTDSPYAIVRSEFGIIHKRQH